MSKIILYTAMSIDGFNARKDGNIDWLSSFDNPTNDDHGYEAFLNQIGTTLMGRKTYEQILTFPTPFPYSGKINYVFSHQKQEKSNDFVQFINTDAVDFVRQLKEENTDGHDIWLIGGQKLNQTLFNAKLVDEMILSIIPIVLGDGIPLFGPETIQQHFQLVQTKTYPTGCVQITYRTR